MLNDIMTFGFNDVMRDPIFDGFLNFPKLRDSYNVATNAMKVEISDDAENNSFIVKAAVPGYKKENMSVKVDNGCLIITGKKEAKKEDKEEKTNKILRTSYTYGEVSRSFELPEGVTPADISAKYDDGELIVTIKKPEVKKIETSNAIEIQ